MEERAADVVEISRELELEPGDDWIAAISWQNQSGVEFGSYEWTKKVVSWDGNYS